MIFGSVYDCEHFSCFKRYGHGFKTKNIQIDQSIDQDNFLGARGRVRALYYISYLGNIGKTSFLHMYLENLQLRIL